MSNALSGFGMLKELDTPPEPEQIEQPTHMRRPEIEPEGDKEPGGAGKRGGKTSNPEYKRVMVLVEKDTAKAAGRKWEDKQPEKDFSDLVQSLLTAYNSGQIDI